MRAWQKTCFPASSAEIVTAECMYGVVPIQTMSMSGVATNSAQSRIGSAVKAANATLGPNQRVAAWRVWHGEDFPRTHTLKVKRDQVRAWAAVESALPVSEGG